MRVRLKGRFSHKENFYAEIFVSDMTTKRPKEPFDPALDAPIALTPDQLETGRWRFRSCGREG